MPKKRSSTIYLFNNWYVWPLNFIIPEELTLLKYKYIARYLPVDPTNAASPLLYYIFMIVMHPYVIERGWPLEEKRTVQGLLVLIHKYFSLVIVMCTVTVLYLFHFKLVSKVVVKSRCVQRLQHQPPNKVAF